MSWYGSHSFLNDHIRKNNCKRIMEIGVLNGENARTMIEVATEKVLPIEVEYYGFDFFSIHSSHEVEQKLRSTGCKFKLFKGNTVNTLPEAVKFLPKMDLIFIDGGKSYVEAESDWKYSQALMHNKTAVFVHNYYFQGVRKMVDNVSREEYQVNIINTPFDADTALIKKRLLE